MFQPLTDEAAAAAREYAFAYQADSEIGAASRGQGLPRQRQDRRSHRERRGPADNPAHRDVHVGSHLLRPLSPAQRGRRGRASLPRRGRRSAQRARRLLRRGRLPAAPRAGLRAPSTCCDHAEEPLVLFRRFDRARPFARPIRSTAITRLYDFKAAEHRAARRPSPRCLRSERCSDTSTSRPTRRGTRWPPGTRASPRISSTPDDEVRTSGRRAHQGPHRRTRQGARHLRRSRAARRAMSRWSSGSTATSRDPARTRSRAAGATAKTRRRSS